MNAKAGNQLKPSTWSITVRWHEHGVHTEGNAHRHYFYINQCVTNANHAMLIQLLYESTHSLPLQITNAIQIHEEMMQTIATPMNMLYISIHCVSKSFDKYSAVYIKRSSMRCQHKSVFNMMLTDANPLHILRMSRRHDKPANTCKKVMNTPTHLCFSVLVRK